MPKKEKLSKRQIDVIDDLFAGELDEQAILQKHKVRAKLYNKWQAEDAFVEQLEKRIAAAHRQSAALIARYAPIAAAKLVQLTQSEKEEIARKACLDIISMPNTPDGKAAPAAQPIAEPTDPPLAPETASKILAILAKEKH